ncbi:tRNA dihydrouridine(20/20a) synthase DusA [Paraphotobacterium marinum]|uniref:tRNA-dihydrouridine(20/20a) synthase n=2 Tax=Paraphotobacterium marinum TaxID=1755811 RepID=A0A220VDC3_9GAMM|nr:tRNA dihydrouridine(20/20a) synthase DusA [Paraphotobacterium marinum]
MIKNMQNYKYKFSVAPMLDWTDRHCRYFYRLMSPNVMLYTEMVTLGAIIYGKFDYLKFNLKEKPLSLQLGGSDPKQFKLAGEYIKDRGFTEINLNIGCPSARVQKGSFGACLMTEPDLVAECVNVIHRETNLPITVKTRIGIDNEDNYEFLYNFIDTIDKKSICDTFVIHARKAILSGLSPKENREIPPLKYDRVYKIKEDFHDKNIIINGGIKNINDSIDHLKKLDGVMIGREVYQNPYILTEIEREFYKSNNSPTRKEVVVSMMNYIEDELSNGAKLNHITRHMLGLFHGVPGGKKWRRFLSENSYKKDADLKVLENALTLTEVNV